MRKSEQLQHCIQYASNCDGRYKHDGDRFQEIPQAEFSEQNHKRRYAGEKHGQNDTSYYHLFRGHGG